MKDEIIAIRYYENKLHKLLNLKSAKEFKADDIRAKILEGLIEQIKNKINDMYLLKDI